MLPNLHEELTLFDAGHIHVAGVDEAGRGAWAGPVCAAAVVLPLDRPDLADLLNGVCDSKQLSPARRESLLPVIRKVAEAVGVGWASPAEVDEVGIVAATRQAMARAVAGLDRKVNALLIDYVRLPEIELPQRAFPKADVHCISVAAASIVAKVTRDRLMVALDQDFPGYGFARHKGYGTRQHREALTRLGPSSIHRMSWRPIQEMSEVQVHLALIHDWLNQLGGAEDVLETLVEMFPNAPIYTSMYWRERMPLAYRTWDTRTSWMDHLPGIYRHHQPYLPFYPLAFARLDLSGYDVVLSNKSGFCHGVRTGEAVHICYCLAPTRYAWDFEAYAAREAIPPTLKVILRPLIALLRRWDYRAAQRVDHFIAISREIQTRIRHYYQRESVVIHPPVETARFQPTPSRDDYYLLVSRLVPYKRIDLAVRAFNLLGLPLVIAGDGRDREPLESLAGPTVTFLGRVPDEDLPDLFARCRAYVLPGVEDFCIAPVQAQAAGRPVIAYGAGGALDTIVEGKTGAFFHEPTSEALAATVRTFDPDAIDPHDCAQNAARFDVSVFKRRLMRFIEIKRKRVDG